jgi:hypothetical protein
VPGVMDARACGREAARGISRRGPVAVTRLQLRAKSKV